MKEGQSIEVDMGGYWRPGTYLRRSPLGVHIVSTPGPDGHDRTWQVRRDQFRKTPAAAAKEAQA